jgi:hypothetical protein
MHTASKVVIGIGIIVIIIGIILITTAGSGFDEKIEEGIIYEGADGDVTIETEKPNEGARYIVHLVDVKYVGGSTGGWNEAHGNNTWNLTEDDCDLVKTFKLNNDDGNQMFYPRCNYVEDGTVDGYIVIGRLCNDVIYNNQGMEIGYRGEGCSAGTYTWDTDGNKVMVYDFGAIIGAIFNIIMKGLGSFGACCCGSLILIIGIVLAFTMDDPKEPAINPITTNSDQQNIPEKKGASSWDDREDYIHRTNDETKRDFEKADKDGDGKIDEEEFAAMMKSQMAIPEDSEDKPKEKKRSGKYDLPPPPEY